jgi:hypothetical protein
MIELVVGGSSRATAQPRNRATAQPRNRATAQPRNRATAQPRNRATAQQAAEFFRKSAFFRRASEQFRYDAGFLRLPSETFEMSSSKRPSCEILPKHTELNYHKLNL